MIPRNITVNINRNDCHICCQAFAQGFPIIVRQNAFEIALKVADIRSKTRMCVCVCVFACAPALTSFQSNFFATKLIRNVNSPHIVPRTAFRCGGCNRWSAEDVNRRHQGVQRDWLPRSHNAVAPNTYFVYINTEQIHFIHAYLLQACSPHKHMHMHSTCTCTPHKTLIHTPTHSISIRLCAHGIMVCERLRCTFWKPWTRIHVHVT